MEVKGRFMSPLQSRLQPCVRTYIMPNCYDVMPNTTKGDGLLASAYEYEISKR